MNETLAFDAIAADYDKNFGESLIGREQRQLSRHWLRKILEGEKKIKILEINCGTGDDALWLASLGHTVMATDQSGAMIKEAEKKVSGIDDKKNIRFIACNFENLANLFHKQKFDLVFSNFSGLNCISPNEMNILGMQLFSLLNDQGHLAVVVFGKHTWWETFFYLLKAQPGKAFRRWGHQSVALLSRNIYQPVYYYSIRQLRQIFFPLKLVEKRPIGLFIPPSYLEGAMKKRPNLFHSLTKLEKKMNGPAISSSFADHVFLLFKKQKL